MKATRRVRNIAATLGTVSPELLQTAINEGRSLEYIANVCGHAPAHVAALLAMPNPKRDAPVNFIADGGAGVGKVAPYGTFGSTLGTAHTDDWGRVGTVYGTPVYSEQDQ